VSSGVVHRVLLRLIGETPRNAARPPREQPLPGLQDDWTPPHWRTEPRASLALMIYPREAPANHFLVHWLFRTFGPPLLEVLNLMTWPLANSNLLACAFWVLAFAWLRARRSLPMLLPWLALMAAGQVLWTAEHHAGMLLVALVAVIWLAAETGPVAPPRLDSAFVLVFAAILVVQIGWSVRSLAADVHGSYDPGPETAQWLKKNAKPRMAAFGFATVSIQPWFSSSPFFDVPASWWQWTSNVEVDGIHRQIVATRPDLVVYGVEFPGRDQIRDQWLPLTHISEAEERLLPRDHIVKDLRDHGYRETHRFCGTRFVRFSSAYRVCDLVFEPVPQSEIKFDAAP